MRITKVSNSLTTGYMYCLLLAVSAISYIVVLIQFVNGKVLYCEFHSITTAVISQAMYDTNDLR